MRGWKTFLGIIRFCLFYFGFVHKCGEMSQEERVKFHSKGDGICCPKCGGVMKYYPGAQITHDTYHDAVTIGHLLPKALGGKKKGENWIQHECNLCNRAHGVLFRELIHKYGKNPLDIPFIVLLKFVIYSIGEFGGRRFNDLDSEYARLREKATTEKVASEKRRRTAKRVARAQAIIDESRMRAVDA